MDPNLVATVMQIESCGDPKAKSIVGAIGLFQVMPFHFQPTDVPQKPAINAKRGLAYLKQGLDELGEPRLALAGYNGGIGIAAMGEEYWPPETVRYVYWADNIYRDAINGRSQSDYLEDWLEHGGSVLCSQAHQRLGL
jgi:soluble lytic murein transglycosylase-like protein